MLLVIQWWPREGFGVSTPSLDDSDYGSGPDEIYTDMAEAMDRVVHLVETGESTVLPEAVRLAERVGVTQANISEDRGA